MDDLEVPLFQETTLHIIYDLSTLTLTHQIYSRQCGSARLMVEALAQSLQEARGIHGLSGEGC